MNPIIILSVLASCAQNMQEPIISRFAGAVIDTFFDGVFAIDIVLRFVVCPYKHAFFSDWFNILDILAVFPFLPLRIAYGFILPEPEDVDRDDIISHVVLSLLLIVIVIPRYLKFLRRFEGFRLIVLAFREVIDVFPVLLYTLCGIVLTFASCMLIVEADNQYWTNSLPMASWFSIVTITTLGYGDTHPEKHAGRMVCVPFIIIGVIYMAMPIGIIGSAFNSAWELRHDLIITHWMRKRLKQFGFLPASIPYLFERYDARKTDGVTLATFRKMMIELNMGISDKRVFKLFNALDTSKRGLVNDKDFVFGVFKKDFYEVYGEGNGLLRMWNGDGTGSTDSSEFRDLNPLDESLSSQLSIKRKVTSVLQYSET
jgi:Ca2+-binding EF-hand superfamily protein